MNPIQVKFNFYLGDQDIFLLSLGFLVVGIVAAAIVYQIILLNRGE
jgi:hypothetical protein